MYVCMYVCTRWSLLDRTMKCPCEGKFVRSCVVETMRPSRTKYRQKSEQNRSKNRRRSTRNRRKSFLGGFWAFKAVSSTRRDPLGHARDDKKRPRSDFWTPRACQESPGSVQKCFRAGPKTLPDRCGAVSERVWSVERCRTRSQNDF